MNRLCFVLTSPFVLNAFLLNHLKALAGDYSITVCTNTQEYDIDPRLDSRVKVIHLPITRGINPVKDLYILFKLITFFASQRYDSVHTLTPKGGLLGMLAARIVGIKHRAHTYTGQVWATRSGLTRWILKYADYTIARCSTSLLADSRSQVEFLDSEKVITSKNVEVLANGSISGVDLVRFSRKDGRREMIRSELGIPSDALVYLYVGRLCLEKGVLDLAHAYAKLNQIFKHVWLIFVGPDEESLSEKLKEITGQNCSIVGLKSTPESYMDAADVLCLPSYREGFGTVVIEAAAMGVPAIGTDIYGLRDSIANGVTGLMVPVADISRLVSAMLYMQSKHNRLIMGQNAQDRARDQFSAGVVTAAWVEYYKNLYDVH